MLPSQRPLRESVQGTSKCSRRPSYSPLRKRWRRCVRLGALHSRGHPKGRPDWSLFKCMVVFLTTPIISISFVHTRILERKPFTERSLFNVNRRQQDFHASFLRGGD